MCKLTVETKTNAVDKTNAKAPAQGWERGDVFVLEQIPTILSHGLSVYIVAIVYVLMNHNGPTWNEIGCGFITYFMVELVSLTLNHRYFSHAAFKTSRPMRFIFAWLAAMGGQFGCLWWSSKHRKHHKFCDLPDDPHSWTQTSFLYAWFGWTISKKERDWELKYLHQSLLIKDKDGKSKVAPELLFVNTFHWLPIFSFHVLLLSLGVPLRDVIWRYTIPTGSAVWPILLFNVTFHPKDKEANAVGCKGLDMTTDPLSYLLGEGLHDHHHAHPNLAHRPGCDLGWYVFLLPMKMAGLIWDCKERGVDHDKQK